MEAAVRGAIEIWRRDGVPLVPASAVLLTVDTERTGEAVAFVVQNGVAQKRAVLLGERQGPSVEIKKGLEGETFRIQKIEKKRTKRNPLPPFITSTLQQEASSRIYQSQASLRGKKLSPLQALLLPERWRY